MTTPCYGCKMRFAGCHSICARYGTWKAERDRAFDERVRRAEQRAGTYEVNTRGYKHRCKRGMTEARFIVWHRIADDRLPDHSGTFLIAHGIIKDRFGNVRRPCVCTAHYYKEHDRFNGGCSRYATHWAEMPTPPIGEE